MKKTRILCLLLALCMCVAVLVACGPDNGGNGGNKGDGINIPTFDGETLTVSVSANKCDEATFPAADVYTKGPDSTGGGDAVQTKVLARNDNVANRLKITVKYKTTDLAYDGVYDAVSKIVQGSATDAPDIYNNDIYGLTRAMVGNMLWNVIDPGEGEVSYFNFDKSGWYKEYMEGATLDVNKQYLLAGDYFIDLIRFAWVLYVKVDTFDAELGATVGTYQQIVDDILNFRMWDMDQLAEMAQLLHSDTVNRGETDSDDAQLGLVINQIAQRLVSYGHGVSYIEWPSGKQGVGTPIVAGTSEQSDPQRVNTLMALSETFRKLYNTDGVLYEAIVPENMMKYFIDGKAVINMGLLGELESTDMRQVQNKGILPWPKYDNDLQSEFYTTVHDQAEVGAILNTTQKFTLASAYMQLINEQSAEVLNEYYETSLKFKYNDSKAVRDMIDFVHDRVVSPFDSVIGRYVMELDTDDSNKDLDEIILDCAKLNANAFQSGYDQVKGVLSGLLAGVVKDFNEKVE